MRQEQLNLFGSGEDSGSRNKRKVIVVPLDTFILLVVVILLLFVLAFSLGVERGRKIQINRLGEAESLDRITTSQVSTVQVQARMPAQVPVVRQEIRQQNITANIPAPKQAQAIIPDTTVKNQTAAVSESPAGYYIQIASYNKESFAQVEANKLHDKGFPVFISKKGDFSVLYVGSFKTKQEAQNSMGLLKKNYKDCILRRF